MKFQIEHQIPGALQYEFTKLTLTGEGPDAFDEAVKKAEDWAVERKNALPEAVLNRLDPTSGPVVTSGPPRAAPSAPAPRSAPSRPPSRSGPPARSAPPSASGAVSAVAWEDLISRACAATGKGDRDRKSVEMHFLRGCAWFEGKDGKPATVRNDWSFARFLAEKEKWAYSTFGKVEKAVACLEAGDPVTLDYPVWNRDKKAEEWRQITYKPAHPADARDEFAAPPSDEPSGGYDDQEPPF
jgi:hypothetical protein